MPADTAGKPATADPQADPAAVPGSTPVAEVAHPPAPEAAPEEFTAAAVSRWCLVASTASWHVACGNEARLDGPVWVPVWCHWEVDWTAVPWDVMPTEITRLGRSEDDLVPDDAVARLGVCDLGVTPPEVVGKFTPLPFPPPATLPSAPTPAPQVDAGTGIISVENTPESPTAAFEPAPNETADATGEAPAALPPATAPSATAAAPAAKTKAPVVVGLATPLIPLRNMDDSPTFNATLEAFVGRYARGANDTSGYQIDLDPFWRLDVNGDGRDDWFGIYRGSPVYVPSRNDEDDENEGDEEHDSGHHSIIEGVAWIDGRRPNIVLDHNIDESSDHDEGLEACGLIHDPATNLVALALHNSGTFGCEGSDDSLALVPFDPTAPSHRNMKPLQLEARPVLRVRDMSANIFRRKYIDHGTFLGFRPGMTVTDVAAVLAAAKAPAMVQGSLRVTPAGVLNLASGPTLHFDAAGTLVGVGVPSAVVAEALRVRGLDDPLLDVLGQGGAALGRVLSGRRPDTMVFDGAIDKALGITLRFELGKDGRVISLELQWYPRNANLGPTPSFLGLRLGRELVALPKALAKRATQTADGWSLAEDGVRLTVRTPTDAKQLLAAIEATPTATPAVRLAKEPILRLVGGPVEPLIALLGPASAGDGTTQSPLTWHAPSARAPVWTLEATVAAGRIALLRAAMVSALQADD